MFVARLFFSLRVGYLGEPGAATPNTVPGPPAYDPPDGDKSKATGRRGGPPADFRKPAVREPSAPSHAGVFGGTSFCFPPKRQIK
jgi:hypothetical protein